MAILRMQAVLTETGHRSHASIYNAIRDGLFTRQVRIGRRSVGWPSEEVKAIVAAQIAGVPEEGIRCLVKDLHESRVGHFREFTVRSTPTTD
jgi:prophage regulatory protein